MRKFKNGDRVHVISNSRVHPIYRNSAFIPYRATVENYMNPEHSSWVVVRIGGGKRDIRFTLEEHIVLLTELELLAEAQT